MRSRLLCVVVLVSGCTSAMKKPIAAGADGAMEPAVPPPITAGSGGTSGSGGGGAGGGGGGAVGVGGSTPQDAAPIVTGGDAAPPSSEPGAPAMAIETVQVPASGEKVTMKTSLAMGEVYLLKASGAVDAGGQMIDAEFGVTGGGMPADEAGGMDLGIDIGVLQIHPAVHTTATPPGPGRKKWAGGYRQDHVYYMTLTGAGAPLSLKLTKPAGGSGAIAVSLVALSPAPPKIGKELETVMIPVTKTIVASTMATQAGKLYVLQAAGFGKVGGGGTHQGDAEYMDWDVAGTRKNEGEAGADFGIGVDETVVGMRGGPGGYTPRMRWWGPWRMDHTYYMVFVGTGKPIQFLYFDSGYGDNSPTDRLTVKIFDVP